MRVTNDQQRQRDSDAKLLLQAELAKQQQQLAELQAAYNNGQPEKQGIEARNYQRYLDRVAEMKRNIERKEADIAAIQQELGRQR